MRTIHCGESESICTMLSINTLPNVLRKSKPATGNLCNICIYEIEPQKSMRQGKQQLTSIYCNRILVDFHSISSSVISLLHFAAIAIIFIRYHRPKQKWKECVHNLCIVVWISIVILVRIVFLCLWLFWIFFHIVSYVKGVNWPPDQQYNTTSTDMHPCKRVYYLRFCD